jgi:hypothetical protein
VQGHSPFPAAPCGGVAVGSGRPLALEIRGPGACGADVALREPERPCRWLAFHEKAWQAVRPSEWGRSSGASYGSTDGSTGLKWHSPTTGRGRGAAR